MKLMNEAGACEEGTFFRGAAYSALWTFHSRTAAASLTDH